MFSYSNTALCLPPAGGGGLSPGAGNLGSGLATVNGYNASMAAGGGPGGRPEGTAVRYFQCAYETGAEKGSMRPQPGSNGTKLAVKHTPIHTHTHTHICIHTYMHTYIHIHTRAHPYTHTEHESGQKNVQSYVSSLVIKNSTL